MKNDSFHLESTQPTSAFCEPSAVPNYLFYLHNRKT